MAYPTNRYNTPSQQPAIIESVEDKNIRAQKQMNKFYAVFTPFSTGAIPILIIFSFNPTGPLLPLLIWGFSGFALGFVGSQLLLSFMDPERKRKNPSPTNSLPEKRNMKNISNCSAISAPPLSASRRTKPHYFFQENGESRSGTSSPRSVRSLGSSGSSLRLLLSTPSVGEIAIDSPFSEEKNNDNFGSLTSCSPSPHATEVSKNLLALVHPVNALKDQNPRLRKRHRPFLTINTDNIKIVVPASPSAPSNKGSKTSTDRISSSDSPRPMFLHRTLSDTCLYFKKKTRVSGLKTFLPFNKCPVTSSP